MKSYQKDTSSSIIFFFLLLFFVAMVGKVSAQMRVVGYYPEWQKYQFPADKIQFENLTHINHAFAWPDQFGNLKTPQDFVDISLVSLAHQNQVKILLSLGGWTGSWGFSAMAEDSAKRTKFIENLVEFLSANGYDGVDFDWEYPASASDRNNLNQLIKETRRKFEEQNSDWLITMAVSASDWSGQWFDYDTLKQYIDWFNAMCYDFHGSWSSQTGHNAPLHQPPGNYDGAVDVGMNYLNRIRGIPKEQLTVGMPFYGRKFNSDGLYRPFTGQVTELTYSEIIPKIGNGWVYHWDEISEVPYLINDAATQFITFDDTASIRIKCDWIKEQNYSGAMIWALGQDFYQNDTPLLKIVGKNLLGAISSVEKIERQFINTVLLTNYPNPFNSHTKISFSLMEKSHINLTIFNIAGQKVKTLCDEDFPAGNFEILWKGDNDLGYKVSSGTYICRLKTNDGVFTKKLLMVE